MFKIENVVADKGSRYAVSGAPANSKKEAEGVLQRLMAKKKYAKATHNSWAIILKDGGRVKKDDGESGAGTIMLQILEREAFYDHVVIVTRWYGGVHLGADRFRHVKTCVKEYLSEFNLLKEKD